MNSRVPAERLISCEPPVSDSPLKAPVIRLAIVCMTKRPANFSTWLSYHREVVGVERFYLRLEDSPGLDEFLTQPYWKPYVWFMTAAGTVRDWSAQSERQCSHVRQAVRQASADGMTHLLHCDDDELLYLPRGRVALNRALSSFACAEVANFYCLNLEVRALRIETSCHGVTWARRILP